MPEVDAFTEIDYAAFTKRVQESTGIRLGEYKSDQMARRLATVAKQLGCRTYTGYFQLMNQNPEVLKQFKDHMTINVTELMRNTDLFEDLAKTVMPLLVENAKGAPLNIWSAGCSYGAEAYTVSMLLNEMTPPPAFKIRGTDLDLTIIAKANMAMFGKMDMNGVSEERRKKHFIQIDENTFMPQPMLRRTVMFTQHDLLSEDYPVDTYDLILCRNVIIYFTDDAKDRIFRNFHKALKPGGVLFLGGTERLMDAGAIGFRAIRPFFYQAQKGSMQKAA